MMAEPHIGFVISAYSVAAVVLAAMISSVVLDYRRLSAEFEEATRRLEDARAPAKSARQ